MSIADADPRVFFAAERTLLAWLRTGLAIIAIGFVVARFGLFVRLLAAQPAAQTSAHTGRWSEMLGVVFVLLGSLAIAAAAWQHGRFIATLTASDLPAAYSRRLAVVLSSGVALLGLALAAYLLVSA